MLRNDLFKVPVYVSNFKPNDKKVFMKDVNTILKKDKGRMRTNIGGYQSNDLPLNNLQELLHKITEDSNLIVKDLNLKEGLNLNNYWININKYKDSNLPHTHTKSVLSGVYYIKVPKNSGRIVFQSAYNHIISNYWLDQYIDKYTSTNGSKWFMEVKEEMLLIFPSWLMHYVEPNLSKDKRISLSFNLDYENR